VGRILYVGGWIAVLILLWPDARHRRFAFPLAIWTAFAVCAFFSSVAEAWPLWIVPAGALLTVLGARAKDRFWPGHRAWIGGAVILFVILLALLGLGKASDGSIRCPAPGVVILGTAKPQIWIVSPNPKVLGEHYGHEIRQGFSSKPIFCRMGVGVASNSADVPSSTNPVIAFGSTRTMPMPGIPPAGNLKSDE